MYDTKFTMNHSRSNVRYSVETVIGTGSNRPGQVGENPSTALKRVPLKLV